MQSCPFLMSDVAVYFSFIKAQASSAGHTAFEVKHVVLKARLQIRPETLNHKVVPSPVGVWK